MARYRRDLPSPAEPSEMTQLFRDMQLEEGPRDVAYQQPWSAEEWEANWRAARDRLIAHTARHRPGTRPWAWWELEAPPGPQDEEFESDWERWLGELEFLAAIGELSKDELDRLLSPRKAPWWRECESWPWQDAEALKAEAEAERDAVLRGLSNSTEHPFDPEEVKQ